MSVKEEGQKVWQLLLNRLRDKYRLVILNEETFEEKLSFKLNRLNVFVVLGLLSMLLVFITSYIIAFTPLREYIPGYTDVAMQRRIYELQMRSDSIERALHSNELYLQNLRLVLGTDSMAILKNATPDTSSKKSYTDIFDKRSPEDSLLRIDYENQSKYNLFYSDSPSEKSSPAARSYTFFCPVKGVVTSKFNPLLKHFGIDIAANSNEPIKAVQEGTVVFSGWTVETGNVIAISHPGNIVSVYKHNSVLLKKEGSVVRAGETIAIIGESGELSTGPHLHLELWINGNPVNPADYIVF
ncbi:MAG TPA: M23 family metallopeptidase [Bacteroidales bacterium]|jgi:murein DD-endopeptidase MepM/ murein hydrolase activator NlpD|nr:M23 family metallopeptidase [Bacteroidales bacterium]